MNSYQSQQFWNDINSVIGLAMSVVAMSFVIGMVRPMGKFIGPPFRPEKHLPEPVAKIVTVPGGSHWLCAKCGIGLIPGEQAVKIGAKTYCVPCARGGSPAPTIRVDTNEEVSQSKVSGVAVAWIADKDVGSLHYEFEIGGIGELPFMQVDEEHRGLGVGEAMYEAVEKLARSYGVKKLTGEVGIPGYGDVEGARRFWGRQGFTVTDDYIEKQLGGNPSTADDSWDNVLRSCRRAAKILGKELTEQDMPANWDELRRLHEDLWAQVYGKRHKKQLGSGSRNPESGGKMKVETDAPLFYKYLTEQEREFRQRYHPLELSDVATLGSHYGEFEISEEELDALVERTPRATNYLGYGAHHKVWIGRWELGMTWDNKLMYAKERLSHNPLGTCYEDAWRFLIKQEEGYLIHGSVQMSAEAPRISHAWVELPSGHIYEPQTGQYFTAKDFRMLSPIEEHKYTIEEAAIMVARVGKHGPWTAEERIEYIGR